MLHKYQRLTAMAWPARPDMVWRRRFFRPPNQNRPHRLTGCGGGDISQMSSSSARTSAAVASAPDTFFTASLTQADPEIAAAIKGELGRQRHEVELIASENIVSRAVLEAAGSVMTNKYAEGLPGARYYGGFGWGGGPGKPAGDRGEKKFGAPIFNVEPDSRRQMEQAGFLALL